MAKNYGVEYPERPLMAVVSDLLGIEHFTTSNGGTVRSDFLQAVLEALGGDPHGLTKDELIRACTEAATGEPFDPALWNVGGTVTNEALQVMVNGVTHRYLNASGDRFQSVPVEFVFPEEDWEYDPAEVRDLRERQLAERALRLGQSAFRTRLLEAYRNSCAITGANAVNALEAAHITPYMGPQTHMISNGLCLRADIHRLWDSGLVAIDESAWTVLLADSLGATTYAELHGRPLSTLPRRTAERPSRAALRAHREWCDL